MTPRIVLLQEMGGGFTLKSLQCWGPGAFKQVKKMKCFAMKTGSAFFSHMLGESSAGLPDPQTLHNPALETVKCKKKPSIPASSVILGVALLLQSLLPWRTLGATVLTSTEIPNSVLRLQSYAH